MISRLRRFLDWRDERLAAAPPQLADESQWYTEHTALLVSTLKWALLGAGAGLCVGLGTRGFLWSLGASAGWMQVLTRGAFEPYLLLPIALPLCVWLIRTFAPDARGHGTEAVIAAIHQRSGRIDWIVAPVKLLATVVTLAVGGSVGKEGPAAQIGAALTSMFADLLRLNNDDRRRLVICGISAGFAAVFGTPVSGAVRDRGALSGTHRLFRDLPGLGGRHRQSSGVRSAAALSRTARHGEHRAGQDHSHLHCVGSGVRVDRAAAY
ncbi:MAG: chloride channel protein [Gemmatimonadaceae bacterium]|nr:chloride channel protein [Gemmatimonadaceae bacterium]